VLYVLFGCAITTRIAMELMSQWYKRCQEIRPTVMP
jgi:hypothetical protein